MLCWEEDDNAAGRLGVDSLLQKPDSTVMHLQEPAVDVCYLGVLVTKPCLQIQTFV